MPFLAQEHIPIPSQDLLSWMFDHPTYDVDEPVSQAGNVGKVYAEG
jgi:4-coumarate--CoA ligase